MSSEIATGIPEREVPRPRPRPAAHRRLKVRTVQILGPITMLAGFVWAIAQPYRVVFMHADGKGLYDYLVQPPLLVVVVGLVYAIAIAPGLVEDLEAEEHGPAS
ncbi:MAG TPA: hypothetical protein VI409_05780 [Gaiellaceae bacterium]|nr:hypothetical protein [Gaiellaceae bacterium]